MRKIFASILTAAALLGLLAGCGEKGAGPAEGGDTIYKDPPELAVIYGGREFTAIIGTTSWSYAIGNGECSGYEACGVHPLDCTELMPAIDRIEGEDSLTLSFREEPEKVSVSYYPDYPEGSLENPEGGYPEAVELQLKDGKILLPEVAAQPGEGPKPEGKEPLTMDCGYVLSVYASFSHGEPTDDGYWGGSTEYLIYVN